MSTSATICWDVGRSLLPMCDALILMTVVTMTSCGRYCLFVVLASTATLLAAVAKPTFHTHVEFGSLECIYVCVYVCVCVVIRVSRAALP